MITMFHTLIVLLYLFISCNKSLDVQMIGLLKTSLTFILISDTKPGDEWQQCDGGGAPAQPAAGSFFHCGSVCFQIRDCAVKVENYLSASPTEEEHGDSAGLCAAASPRPVSPPRPSTPAAASKTGDGPAVPQVHGPRPCNWVGPASHLLYQRVHTLSWAVHRAGHEMGRPLLTHNYVQACSEVKGSLQVLVKKNMSGSYESAILLEHASQMDELPEDELYAYAIEVVPRPPPSRTAERAGSIDGVKGKWRYVKRERPDTQPRGAGGCGRSQCEMRCTCDSETHWDYEWSFVPDCAWLRPAALCAPAVIGPMYKWKGEHFLPTDAPVGDANGEPALASGQQLYSGSPTSRKRWLTSEMDPRGVGGVLDECAAISAAAAAKLAAWAPMWRLNLDSVLSAAGLVGDARWHVSAPLEPLSAPSVNTVLVATHQDPTWADGLSPSVPNLCGAPRKGMSELIRMLQGEGDCKIDPRRHNTDPLWDSELSEELL